MKFLTLLIVSCLVPLVPLAAVADGDRLAHVIRFSDYDSGSEEDWLQAKGFQFRHDMQKRNFIDLEVTDDSLLIEAKRRALGIMLNETVNVADFSHVEIDWGVNQFPVDVSYEQGVRNEAIMLIVFMGDERMPSGSIFIPDSPYFIGLFPCHGEDRMNHPYQGRFFRKQGRYVCLDRPAPGESITSRFDLLEGYRTFFDKERDDDPGISGLAIALDTKKAGDRGRSSAFIKEIRIYH